MYVCEKKMTLKQQEEKNSKVIAFPYLHTYMYVQTSLMAKKFKDKKIYM